MEPTVSGPSASTKSAHVPQAPSASPAGPLTGGAPNRLHDRRESWYIKQVAHTFERVACDQKGRWLGLAAVILTTVIGTSAFSTLGENPGTGAKLVVAVLSVVAAIATAVKEYAQYEKRSAAHLSAAATYGELRNGVERLVDHLTTGTTTGAEADQELLKLEKSADGQETKSPAIPERTYGRAKKWVQDRTRERGEPLGEPRGTGRR